MNELWAKIREALISALPITLIVYLVALLPGFSFNQREIISFTIGAVLLVLGIGLFNLGADIAMTPMGTHVGAGLSRQKSIGLLLAVSFILGMLITIAEPDLQVLANQVSSVMNGKLLIYTVGFGVAAFFGITIHAEKELLMLVVEKEIRDRVLHALYQQMGMQKKAQGIVFSLPVSDVAGLAKAPEKEEK